MSNIVDPNFINSTVALEYIAERFQKLGLRVPVISTLHMWFKKRYVETYLHRYYKGWFTKVDWIDEAIMWKRIPPGKGRKPRKGRPSLAQETRFTAGSKEYIATQEYLL